MQQQSWNLKRSALIPDGIFDKIEKGRLRLVDPRVDDFAVTGACFASNLFMLFDHKDLMAGNRECSSDS